MMFHLIHVRDSNRIGNYALCGAQLPEWRMGPVRDCPKCAALTTT